MNDNENWNGQLDNGNNDTIYRQYNSGMYNNGQYNNAYNQMPQQRTPNKMIIIIAIIAIALMTCCCCGGFGFIIVSEIKTGGTVMHSNSSSDTLKEIYDYSNVQITTDLNDSISTDYSYTLYVNMINLGSDSVKVVVDSASLNGKEQNILSGSVTMLGSATEIDGVADVKTYIPVQINKESSDEVRDIELKLSIKRSNDEYTSKVTVNLENLNKNITKASWKRTGKKD